MSPVADEKGSPEFHDSILSEGDDVAACAVSIKLCRELGLTEEEIAELYPDHYSKYDPNQPRDDWGRWTDGGATGGNPAQKLYEQNRGGEATLEELRTEVNKVDPNYYEDAAKIEAEIAANITTKDRYSSNGVYTAERTILHEKILMDMFRNIGHAVPQEGEAPTLVLTGGRPASGKTTALGLQLQEAIGRSIYINADEIQEKLPGYQGKYAGLYNGEAQDIALQAESIARINGLNIVYDATLKSQAPAKDRVSIYKAAGYKVEGYFVHTTPKTSAIRSVQRFRGNTGRYIPLALSFNSRTNEKTFDSLIPEFSRWAIYDNNGTTARKIASGP